MRLPSGSDVHESSTQWRPDAKTYSAAYFEFPDMRHESAAYAGRGLLLSRDLQRAGIMSMQPATPLVMHQPDELAGARFDLRPDLHRYLRSEDRRPCLAYADLQLSVEWIGASNTATGSQALEFLAIAQPKRFYEWVNGAEAKSLPVIDLVRRHGMGATGTATFANGSWRVKRLEFLQPAYAPTPNWKELFASLPRASDYRRANAAKTTPEIQAIAVRSSGTWQVTVNGTGRPMILHLSSELPADWRLRIADDAKVVRVVASASTGARVRGVPFGVPLDIFDEGARKRAPSDRVAPSLVPPLSSAFNSGAYAEAVSDAAEGGPTTNLALVESLLGGEITVIQTEWRSKEFTVPRRYRAPE
jgi:hypothetical protein